MTTERGATSFPRAPWERKPQVFCFNLDADEELRDPAYRPRRELLAQVRKRIGATGLVGAHDVPLTLDDAPAPAAARGLPGDAWCPTPRARERLTGAGARLEPCPDVEVLRAVNHRAFAVALGDVVPVHLVSDLDELRALVDRCEDEGLGFVAKPGHGFAGRGHVRLGHVISELDARSLAAPLAREGVVLEPWLDRESDFALHGYVLDDGRLRLGQPMGQRCDARGIWQRSEPVDPGDLGHDEQHALWTAAEETACALHRAGYFGPFGIDAFRYRDRRGRRRFRPRVEINARFTMAWAAGFWGTTGMPAARIRG